MNDDFVGVSREFLEAAYRAIGCDVDESAATPDGHKAPEWSFWVGDSLEAHQAEMREFWRQAHDSRRAGLKPVATGRAGDFAGMTPEQIEQRLRDLAADSGRGA